MTDVVHHEVYGARYDTSGEVIASMTLDQQIGQLVMVGFSGTRPTNEVLDLIRSRHVGGVILFSRNLRTPSQMRRLTKVLQAAARAAGHPFPLLIATDQENGIVRRTGSRTTSFPGNMALGAIDSEAATEAAARATGKELRALGITMNLAPVVDISNNPANPVIGVRSFGADPALVARHGAAFVRGLQQAGVAATLKHFPGHGDTAVDSHLALPVVPFDLRRLESIELVPFRRGIAAGADAIMTAHVAMPALTGSETLPATLAPPVIRGLLRERLGYDGVIITDCLEMRAISKGVGIARGAVQSVQAGADIVLISHRFDRQMAGLAAIHAAVASGELSAKTIQAAATRVLRLKQRLLTWDELEAPHGIAWRPDALHQQLADDLYARSMTIIRDRANLLPVHPEDATRLLVVSQAMTQKNQAADRGFVPTIFVDALRRLVSDATERPDDRAPTTVAHVNLAANPTDDDYAALRHHALTADTLIMLPCNAHLPRQYAASSAIVRVLQSTERPLIGVAVCDPYDAMVFEEVGTWLATYDYLPPALEAAARALVGASSATGTLPVSF